MLYEKVERILIFKSWSQGGGFRNHGRPLFRESFVIKCKDAEERKQLLNGAVLINDFMLDDIGIITRVRQGNAL